MTRPCHLLVHACAAFTATLALVSIALPVVAAPGETTLLSVTTSGQGADGYISSISPDGRFVLFYSSSADILPGGNGPGWIVRDRWLGTGAPLLVDEVADQPTVSANGRLVAFSTSQGLAPDDYDYHADVYVRDVLTYATTLVSEDLFGPRQNAHSLGGTISANGRYVAFYSDASNLVPGDTNGTSDVFVRDLQSGVTERVSVATDGTQANGTSNVALISPDGRYVVFQSDADTLSPGDSHRFTDVFIRDRVMGVTERISIGFSGADATNESYVGGQINGLSPDGRYVVFTSNAGDLIAGDTNGMPDAFVRDRERGVTERVSIGSTGAQGNSYSRSPSISADGRYVTFRSAASNLVTSDVNAREDAFVRDRSLGTTVRVNVSSLGVQSNGAARDAILTADGTRVFFNDTGTNLVDVPTPAEVTKAYLHELGAPVPGGTTFVVDEDLAFGDATINFDARRNVVFTNTGVNPISIDALGVTGPNATAFTATNRCPIPVVPASACNIEVIFHPYAVGVKAASLLVTAGGDTRSVQLHGRGVLAQFTVSVAALDFGAISVGTSSAQQKVRISNTGTSPFPVKWIGIMGVNAADFHRLRWCPGVLEPGRVCNIPVWFEPQLAGAKTARLVVSPGKSGSPKYIALTGTGQQL